MQRQIESQLNAGSNEDAASALLLTFCDDNIEEFDKQNIVTNIGFEAIVHSVKG